tara:strand:+ start:360 stop:965 length:606 start_codon:yes stop_codon:yes gene_type:complete
MIWQDILKISTEDAKADARRYAPEEVNRVEPKEEPKPMIATNNGKYELSRIKEDILKRKTIALPASKLHSKKKYYSGFYLTSEGRKRREAGETANLSAEEIDRMGFGWVEKILVSGSKYDWTDNYGDDERGQFEMIKGDKTLSELINDLNLREGEGVELKSKIYRTVDESGHYHEGWGSSDRSDYVVYLYSKSQPVLKKTD